ncbi:hypothetical protein AB0A95_24170 [Micromonospora sp. NPDC049230]|uniref:hypothetical protein n=1 Tax=Micromonospora sp. NPDC049230 TaxID=3155502 RepID=UPI0033EAEBEE
MLAGAAWNVGSLIAFRVLQGLGGGLLNPVGMAVGLLLLCPGLALAVGGLSVTGERGGVVTATVLLPLALGATLVVAFAWPRWARSSAWAWARR